MKNISLKKFMLDMLEYPNEYWTRSINWEGFGSYVDIIAPVDVTLGHVDTDTLSICPICHMR